MDGKRPHSATPDETLHSPNFSQNMNSTRIVYVVVRHGDTKKTMASFSPFLIDKVLRSVVKGTLNSVKLQHAGTLLIGATEEQAKLLLKISDIGGVKVEVTLHKFLNLERGVIRGWEFAALTETELQAELASYKVTDVQRLTKVEVTDRPPAFLLTFQDNKIPDYIPIGFLRTPVKPYFPPPLRCFKCNQYGHTQMRCNRQHVCPKCSVTHDGVSHDEKTCTAPLKCIACKGDHDVRSNKCPKYQEETKVKRYSIKNSITIPEARKEIKISQANATYAQITNQGVQSATSIIQPSGTVPQTSATPNQQSIASQSQQQQISKGILNTNCSACSNVDKVLTAMNKKIDRLFQLMETVFNKLSISIPKSGLPAKPNTAKKVVKVTSPVKLLSSQTARNKKLKTKPTLSVIVAETSSHNASENDEMAFDEEVDSSSEF